MTIAAPERAVAWHDAECGGYAADLPIWRSLAGPQPARILDIGCGSGRVAIDLARAGHRVTAVDIDPALIDALAERAAARDLAIETHVADARDLVLAGRFDLIAIPMQTLQMLGPGADRVHALARAADLLAPGGRIAAAILDGVPDEGTAGADSVAGVLPDVAEREGWTFSSLPLGIEHDGETLEVRRLRQLVSPAGDLTDELHFDRLWITTADELDSDARRAGLEPAGRLSVPDTDDHVGSTVVVWSAA